MMDDVLLGSLASFSPDVAGLVSLLVIAVAMALPWTRRQATGLARPGVCPPKWSSRNRRLPGVAFQCGGPMLPLAAGSMAAVRRWLARAGRPDGDLAEQAGAVSAIQLSRLTALRAVQARLSSNRQAGPTR
jgi:hypothetical protein